MDRLGHRRILLRTTKGPFEVRSPRETLDHNLIASNSGNLVFLEAAWKLLSAPGVEITPDRLSAQPGDADEINERYDAYVIPLANAFRGKYEPSLVRMTALIRRLRIPVVILGVGAQGTPDYRFDALTPIRDTVRGFVSAVLDRSPAIGVRGEATEAYLRGLGFSDVEVIGCPSMFAWGRDLRVVKRVPALDRESRVAITISPYRERMGPIVEEARRRFPNLTYYAQDFETLALLLTGTPLPYGVPGSSLPVTPDHPLFTEGRTKLFVDPWPWIDDLRGQDFSFGSRIHGSIAAILAGTPAYLLAHDSRTLELARHFGIPHRLLRDAADGVDPAELYATADYSDLMKGHADRFEAFTRYMASNGLDHAFAHEGAAEAFDRQVAATRYPGPATFAGGGTTGAGSAFLGLRLRTRRTLRSQRLRSLRTWLARRF